MEVAVAEKVLLYGNIGIQGDKKTGKQERMSNI